MKFESKILSTSIAAAILVAGYSLVARSNPDHNTEMRNAPTESSPPPDIKPYTFVFSSQQMIAQQQIPGGISCVETRFGVLRGFTAMLPGALVDDSPEIIAMKKSFPDTEIVKVGNDYDVKPCPQDAVQGKPIPLTQSPRSKPLWRVKI